ncbi:hypothetical protein [Nioella sp.]|uniref:hypothetical protein n=1 Tax=Nioella sp. TaxID=1912091 RepID=UPI0035177C43
MVEYQLPADRRIRNVERVERHLPPCRGPLWQELRDDDARKPGKVQPCGERVGHHCAAEHIVVAQPALKLHPVCSDGSGHPSKNCEGPQDYLRRRDETDSYHAWRDIGTTVEWLDDSLRRSVGDEAAAELTVYDARMAMARIAARRPFLAGKFSRKPVDQAFGDART